MTLSKSVKRRVELLSKRHETVKLRNKKQNLEIKSLQSAQVGPQGQIAAVENTSAVADAVNTTINYTHSRFIDFTSHSKAHNSVHNQNVYTAELDVFYQV